MLCHTNNYYARNSSTIANQYYIMYTNETHYIHSNTCHTLCDMQIMFWIKFNLIIEILFLLLELIHFLFLTFSTLLILYLITYLPYTLTYSLLTLCTMYILYYIVLYILV